MSKKEIVPVVVHHKDGMYQVFCGEYCRDSHTIKKTGKEYSCFHSIEETEAYIKGLSKNLDIIN